MPHIVLISRGTRNWEGGRQYTLNLLRALMLYRGDSNSFDLSLLVHSEDDIAQYEALRGNLRTLCAAEDVQEPYVIFNRVRWRFKRSLLGWNNPRFEEALLRLGATFAYPARSKKVLSADWIPDFQYKHYPDGSNPEEIAGRKQDFANIVKDAGRVVLSSICAERDCHELFPESIAKTSVLQFRVFAERNLFDEDPTTTVAHYHLPTMYVLVSNLLAPTKNHTVVLDALSRIDPSDRARLGIHIVFTGDIYDHRNPGFYNGFFARIHQLGLQKSTSLLGLIPKRDQFQLLRASLAYLQPSLFEGWNTGVEEAHMLGKRILLSDIPVHREQCPPRATFFDPQDTDNLARSLLEVFTTAARDHFDISHEQAAINAYSQLQKQFAFTFIEMTKALSAPH